MKLVWPIRRSFLAYLAALDDAVVECSDGAVQRPDGAFAFPAEATETAVQGSGAVHISAHGGALDLRIADPTIRLDPGLGWVLEWGPLGDRVPRARLLDMSATSSAGPHGIAGIAEDVALTVAGAELFGGSYGPWVRMDPVVVELD